MADGTYIEWSDATWQIITGCSIVSKGCTNCYAMKLAGGRLRHHPSRAGLTMETKAGPVWTGEVRFNEQWLDQPLRWKAPRKIFVCAHGDLFAEGVPDEWIDRVFAVMALASHHTFQVLTKRPERMRAYLTKQDERRRDRKDAVEIAGMNMVMEGVIAQAKKTYWPLPNVWLGTSAEDQATADVRIPELLATPAAFRFVSAEPLLGRLYLDKFLACTGMPDCEVCEHNGRHLDWVIVGGESGPGARPMHPAWARSIRDQCQAVGTAFFFKQWGAWAPTPGARGRASVTIWPDGTSGKGAANDKGGVGCQMVNVGKAAAGRLLDGRGWSEFPAPARQVAA